MELDTEAVIHGGCTNDNDDAEDEDEAEDETHDDDAAEGNSDEEEEDASDDDDEEEEDNIIVIDDDSDNDDIIVIDDDSDNDNDNDDDDIIVVDDDSDSDDDIPTPDEVEVEYTFPDDFRDREWYEVMEDGRGPYFRLIIDCKNANITEIRDKQFQHCQWLIEVVCLNNTDDSMINNDNYLRRIGKHAFQFCLNLQRITNGLPLGLIELDDGAFGYCSSLSQEIVIPRKVQVVGIDCFIDCYCITSVVFDHLPTDSVNIGHFAFGTCTGLRSATLPPSLPSIPAYCFNGCVLLINIPIPIHVRGIGDCAFKGCLSLRSIDIFENIDRIHSGAYRGCTSLETVTIKSSTVQFGRHVFRSCPSLTTIKVYPWVLPRIFAAMSNNDNVNDEESTNPNFCYKLLRQSQYQLSRFRQP